MAANLTTVETCKLSKCTPSFCLRILHVSNSLHYNTSLKCRIAFQVAREIAHACM